MTRRTLVAGIGNIFMADDGFGVEVVRRLAQGPVPDGVEVVDFGIRGMDLVYALLSEYETVIFVDAAPRGGTPGTVYLIEPHVPDDRVTLDVHGMDPVKVLGLARMMGAPPHRTFVVGCEPLTVPAGGDDLDIVVGLSEPVAAAVDEAIAMVLDLVETDTAVAEPAPAEPPMRR